MAPTALGMRIREMICREIGTSIRVLELGLSASDVEELALIRSVGSGEAVGAQGLSVGIPSIVQGLSNLAPVSLCRGGSLQLASQSID